MSSGVRRAGLMWSAQALDVTFVRIPKCLNFNLNSGLTPGKSSRRVNAECTALSRCWLHFNAKSPSQRWAFCVCE